MAGELSPCGQAISNRQKVLLYDNHAALILFQFINTALADPSGRAV
jgi:hypothetical protein